MWFDVIYDVARGGLGVFQWTQRIRKYTGLPEE